MSSVNPQSAIRNSQSGVVLKCALVKSSVMVGLGETQEELVQTFHHLVGIGVTHLTIGQYLRPDADHLPVMEFVSPERFCLYETLAYEHGFAWVKAGPFVRSSYHAIDAVGGVPR